MVVKKYDLIFSCGESCVNAINLRKNNLRIESYPFDWIKFFNIKLFLYYLQNNFTDYFIKSNLVKLYDGSTQYIDKSNGVQYIHDFNCLIRFDDEYEIVKKRINKRLKRLFFKIKKSKKILMMYTSFKLDPEMIDSFLEVQKIYPDKKLDLLYVILDNNIFEYELMESNYKNIKIIKMPYEPKEDAASFPEEWAKILKNYQIKKPIKYYLDFYYKKLKNKFVKNFK